MTTTTTSSLPSAPLPTTVGQLVKKLAPGWTYRVTHGTGTVTKKPVDPDTRKKVTKQLPCVSVGLRLRHEDGRAAVGVWVDGSFDSAWSWEVCRDETCELAGIDHPADLPRQIDATTLGMLAASSSAAVFAAAVAGAAARKAAKQAGTTDLLTSGSTEQGRAA